MASCMLFIDGENFLHKVEEIVKLKGSDFRHTGLSSIDFNTLLKEPLEGFRIARKIFYAARLHVYPGTRKKSEELIKRQRKLHNSLVRQGFELTLAGNVRAQRIDSKIAFREKGVDVKIAVDLVSLACAGKMNTAIICSSDSDLQPAIAELKKRRVQVVYVGFEASPNKGLSFTADRTILLRNHEVVEATPFSLTRRAAKE